MSSQKINFDWTKSGVIYQIYPRSFKDSNNDGIGDLQGIIDKLDYLNDGSENSFGINAIWISPFYKSPMVDFGYDVSDYYNVDPIFGDLKTFDRLVTEAHFRDIKIILDYIPNHTSDQHPWFIESRSSKDNPKRDWYIWKEPKPEIMPPNNWLSVFGGSVWQFDKKTNQYYMHSFLKEQPDLNWRNPEVVKEMFKVMRFWLDKGVDGFRTDAIYHLIKDDKFRDNPPNPNYKAGKDDPYLKLIDRYNQGHEDTLKIGREFSKILSEKKSRFMVSEAYLDVEGLKKFYKNIHNGSFAPLNFNLISLAWNAAEYKRFLDQFEEALGVGDIPTYVLGNHDRSRVASRLGQKRARLAAMLTFTLRGMPFIYNGEEIGMEDGEIKPSQVKDPFEKNVPGIKLGRDPERTPMQWNNQKYAGFSNSKTWLPVAKNYKSINVESEQNDPKSILALYKKLIHFRKKSKALLYGKYSYINLRNSAIFSFGRHYGDEKILVIVNFTMDEQTVSLNIKKAEIICNTYMDWQERKLDFKKFILRKNEGYVIKILD